jgi:hypothetical protein
MTNLPHSCGRCATRWAGTAVAHCGACHMTTTGISAFSAHRRAGQCLTPAEAGLTARDRGAYTAWGLPGDDANTERLRALRAA